VESAITNAKQYLYIEDQYFVSRRIKNALLAKLRDPQFKFLLVLMQHSSAFENSANLIDIGNEFPYLIAARNEIRTDFTTLDPQRKKWRFFTLKAATDTRRQEWSGSYVHAKIVLADDDFAVIGTANADDRGYTFDTEVVAGITDDPLGKAAGQSFTEDLRVALWNKHLGVQFARLNDWSAGLAIWLSPPASSMVADASPLEDSPLLGSKPVLRDFPQENRLWKESIDPDADLLLPPTP
jgi:phosphatidylserine/phosphatidylglycerophosphate/cardiolipin synthase-like enzyme